MSKAQQRLDELLALSDEELDELALNARGWKVYSFLNGMMHKILDENGDTVEIQCFSPSTDLNQAWALAMGGSIGIDGPFVSSVIGGSSVAAELRDCDLAKCMTAFGILARELENATPQ